MTELLMPAGNLKKLKTAFYFGADAVYVGLKTLSLRAYADNFSEEELIEGINYAHNLGKKVYVAVNIFAKNADIPAAEEIFKFLAQEKADAAIVSDVGLVALARKAAPELPIHLSTQANTTNSLAVSFWKSLGVRRVVLARELSISEIREIRAAVPDMELETFVHGAMCVSYSGRCLLSSYFSGRSSNRGECIQPCRWNYKLSDMKSGSSVEIEEDEHGSYFMNSCDLRLLSRLPELVEAGVSSFKVEGRMKSEFYVASVALAYRRALDEYLNLGKIEHESECLALLENISHRPYTEAFFDGANLSTISESAERTEERYKFIAVVVDVELPNNEVIGKITSETSDNGKIEDETAENAITGNGIADIGEGKKWIKVQMRNRFFKGDRLFVLSPKSLEMRSFVCEGIIDAVSGEETTDAKLVEREYFIKTDFPLAVGDILLSARD